MQYKLSKVGKRCLLAKTRPLLKQQALYLNQQTSGQSFVSGRCVNLIWLNKRLLILSSPPGYIENKEFHILNFAEEIGMLMSSSNVLNCYSESHFTYHVDIAFDFRIHLTLGSPKMPRIKVTSV